MKNETATELKKKYKKVSKDEAMTHWKMQFDSSAVRCSHAYWYEREKYWNYTEGSVRLTIWFG